MTRLRQTPIRSVVRRLVPGPVRRALWRTVGSEAGEPELVDLAITDATRNAIVEQLRPDLLRLRDHLGADFDCWGLLADPLAR
jgi:hypothetical protein